jgi:hypothetical protein
VTVCTIKIRRLGGVCMDFYTEAGNSGVRGDGVGWVELRDSTAVYLFNFPIEIGKVVPVLEGPVLFELGLCEIFCYVGADVAGVFEDGVFVEL